MFVAFCTALFIGIVMYALCRLLFAFSPPLALIVFWVAAIALRENYLVVTFILLFLPLVICAMVGGYFFSKSTPKWKNVEVKWFVCCGIMFPLQYLCGVLGTYDSPLYPLWASSHKMYGASSADFLYVCMLSVSPNIAAFLWWGKMEMGFDSPEQ